MKCRLAQQNYTQRTPEIIDLERYTPEFHADLMIVDSRDESRRAQEVELSYELSMNEIESEQSDDEAELCSVGLEEGSYKLPKISNTLSALSMQMD